MAGDWQAERPPYNFDSLDQIMGQARRLPPVRDWAQWQAERPPYNSISRASELQLVEDFL